MNISSTDGKASVNVGGKDTWLALTSTIRVLLGHKESALKNVFDFLRNGKCAAGNCLETARQFNLVRDELSRFAPDKMVYDEKNPQKQPPWGNNISPVITSCGNCFTSGDGYDLLAETVRVLTYAAYAKCGIQIQ